MYRGAELSAPGGGGSGDLFRAEARAASPDIGAWWAAFDDPVFDDLIARAQAGNLDLRQAAARVETARAQERVVRARGGPRSMRARKRAIAS